MQKQNFDFSLRSWRFKHTLCHVHGFRLMHTRPIRHSSVVGTLCLIPFIMTKGGKACPVAHHNHHSTAILLQWCTQNCHSTACPVALVHTTTVIAQLILSHWCMPQLSWHSLSFCTGAHHNSHSRALYRVTKWHKSFIFYKLLHLVWISTAGMITTHTISFTMLFPQPLLPIHSIQVSPDFIYLYI